MFYEYDMMCVWISFGGSFGENIFVFVIFFVYIYAYFLHPLSKPLLFLFF